jgi:hypothetical protein
MTAKKREADAAFTQDVSTTKKKALISLLLLLLPRSSFFKIDRR